MIGGIVFEDANGNGVRDAREPGIAGVAISMGARSSAAAPMAATRSPPGRTAWYSRATTRYHPEEATSSLLT
jgi:hypothetical protein